MTKSIQILAVILVVFLSNFAFAGVVSFKEDQLFIDSVAQPQLFGAEIQYFRLRGGYEKNIPREKVLALWNKVLDKVVEAKMNMVSFYIPWDFHEYAEGKFDFTGSVDEDGDGKADYPSRDIQTFFRLIQEHGITRIMVRPGPYINAEWGFLGFGAIPKWFHEKHPEAHMKNSSGKFTDLYDYHNPDYLAASAKWFSAVYNQVLVNRIGPGKPISFVQIDNETNFMWQSIYNHDYGDRAIARYREFLKNQYGDLNKLNRTVGRNWTGWEQIQPPKDAGKNLSEDHDWYQFQDFSIFEYLKKIRGMWEVLGITEPNVLFTLAESYNAGEHGLLPNYNYRNAKNQTGLMTVNLYPKTNGFLNSALFNNPFKADHDVKAANTSNDSYFGKKVDWVMGPEIQGGWWRLTDVSEEARRQTYLTTIGHGMKAMLIYYFHEGDNWQGENSIHGKSLYFDAPLDGDGNPRDHYAGVKKIGEKLIAPYQDYLGRATSVEDPICILEDDATHATGLIENIDSQVMNGEWSAGLVGFLLQAGINPMIIHWGLSNQPDLKACKLLFRQDNGLSAQATADALKDLILSGSTVVNFLSDTLGKQIGIASLQEQISVKGSSVNLKNGIIAEGSPLFRYKSLPANCVSHMQASNGDSVAYDCKLGSGHLIQVGALFYNQFNSDKYEKISDVKARRNWLETLLHSVSLVPQVKIAEGGERTVVFARTDGKKISVTVKSAQKNSTAFHVQVQNVSPSLTYKITDVFTSVSQNLTGLQLQTTGFAVSLPSEGSSVCVVEQ